MSTLWKRASPREAKVLRIICGAVLNTNDAHPGKYKVDARFARGVAKRAVGTMSSQMEGLLAVGMSRPSLPDSGHSLTQIRVGDSLVISGKRSAQFGSRTKRAGDTLRSLALIKRAEASLRRRVNPARAKGEHERAAALVEALTVIGTLRKRAERSENAS